MPNELVLTAGKLVGALLILARVAGAFVFVPIPGARHAPTPAKLLLVFAITLSLFPSWPDAQEGVGSIGWLVINLVFEATLGIAVGFVVSLTTEVLLVAFQVLGLQAGYSFAAAVDPETQADSGVLLVLGQLTSGLMFFTLGLHREVLLVFARSVEVNPPGNVLLRHETVQDVIKLGSDVFLSGMRLALPVVVFLLMVDLSLALMGRINSHLQLIFLAFPAKMLMALSLSSVLLLIVPEIYSDFAQSVLGVITGIVAGR
jgi:flagellar biosynthesis protein FliR